MRAFGLIGNPLSHSFSQQYFQQKFIRDGITDATFNLFPIPSIQQLLPLFNSHKDLLGLAVTIPYKKEVIPFLKSVDEVVTVTGACNCIKKTEAGWIGYNTDVTGFELSFTQHLKPRHTHALILGTGGAAAAVAFVLKKLHIGFLWVTRKISGKDQLTYKDLDVALMEKYSVIINCTPLGTFPATDEKPAIPFGLLSADHYLFDMVYNPPLTAFLSEGKKAGCTVENGFEMLTLQAEENWRIWNE